MPTGIGRRGGGTPSRRTILAAAMRVPAGCPRSCPVVQGVDAVGGLPAVGHQQTRHRPSVACSCLLTIARPDQGKTHDEPPTREPALRKGCSMELTIPATPAHLAGLRQAARHALREVPPQIAEELVLALDEAA